MKKYYNIVLLFTFILIFSFLFLACKENKSKFHIGIIQWTEEISPFNQTYKGLIDGLNDTGYSYVINLEIDYINVEQDKRQAIQAAKKFVNNGVDVIVALGTGSSLAALEATQINKIPIVFSIVGAPKATGIIDGYHDSGQNITGVSMKIPVKEQFAVLNEILPEIKRICIIYCTEMPQAIATGKEAFTAAYGFGWTPKSIALLKDELSDLDQVIQNLTDKVDVLYIPTDPVLYSPEYRDLIIRSADERKIPVMGVDKKSVEKGMLLAVHCDFYEIGRQTADPVIRVLQGEKVQTIPSQVPVRQKISLNLKKAQQLNIHVKRNIILKADDIVD